MIDGAFVLPDGSAGNHAFAAVVVAILRAIRIPATNVSTSLGSPD